MTTIPDGAYAYYHTPDSERVVCEVRSVWVYRLGYDGGMHVGKFTGVFVPLVEAAQVEQTDSIDTTQAK